MNYQTLAQLVLTSREIVVATVNEDGSPHNSPLFFIPELVDAIRQAVGRGTA